MNEYEASEIAQALFEEAGDALLLFDPDTNKVVDANPMAQQLSGFGHKELLNTDVTYLFRAEIQGGLHALGQASRKTGFFHAQDGFFLRTQHEGVWTPVNLTVTRLHVKPKTLGLITARDIRAQREAYHKLKKMEGEYTRVLASISDCIWTAGVDSRGEWLFRYFSPAFERMVGQSSRHFLGSMHRWWGLIHPEDRHIWEKAFVRLRAGEPSQAEYRIVAPDGKVRWLRDSIVVDRGEDEQPARMDGVLSDITARKEAEERLREREEHYRRMLETGAAGLWVLDAEDRLTFTNARLAQLLGRTADALVGQPLAALTDADGQAIAATNLERCRQRCTTAQEYKFRRQDGTDVWLTVVPNPSFDRDGRYAGSLGLITGVADKKAIGSVDSGPRTTS
jgi:PAS domain S-box-containing protein